MSVLSGAEALPELAERIVIERRAQVNLMPQEIFERRALRKLQSGLAAGVLAVAATVGLLYLHERAAVSGQQTQLAAAEAQTLALQTQLGRLATVRSTYAEVDVARSLLTQALGGEVLWSHYLTDLSVTIPTTVWLTAVSATEAPQAGTSRAASPATGATTAAPASPAAVLPGSSGSGIGTVTFTGVALHRNDVATWLESLAREKGYAAPYSTSITETTIGSRVVYDFSSSVILTPGALSNRAAGLLGS